MFLIAGLGNPDKKYEKTRHNIGFDTVDALAEKYNISITEKKHKALCGSGVIEGVKVILAKPQTYMNLSGESIAEIVNFYKLDPESEMLIIFDDISLAPGNIRVRKKGSAGGHNGIKSIISSVGTSNFMRIKVGVGEKPQGWDLALRSVVLSISIRKTACESARNSAPYSAKISPARCPRSAPARWALRCTGRQRHPLRWAAY